jgi:hypothetical protein
MVRKLSALIFAILMPPILLAAVSEGASFPARPLEIVAPANPEAAGTPRRTINRS